MTVRNLLTMTAGIDWNESLPYADPRNSATGLEVSPDWVKYTLNPPDDGGTGEAVQLQQRRDRNRCVDLFRRATGTDVEEYAAKNLFAPLGMIRTGFGSVRHPV